MFIWKEADNIRLIDEKERLDYFHQDETYIASTLSAFDAYCEITKDTPWWVDISFKVRDKISALVGVKKINGFSSTKPIEPPKIGEYLDFFLVEFISNDEIALTSRDKHLSVMVFIKLTNNNTEQRKLLVTTSVITHNLFGKIYMLPVAPMHDIIVRNSLKKLDS